VSSVADPEVLANAICDEAVHWGERWRRLAHEAESAAVRWTWAPAGSELHRPEVAWIERDRPPRPSERSGAPPPGKERDRFGYDADGRVVMAVRPPHAGAERLLECFLPEATGTIGISYVPDRGLYRVMRQHVDQGRISSFAACESLWPDSRHRAAIVELYRWRGAQISQLQRRRFVPGEGGMRRQSLQTYEFEYNDKDGLIGCYVDGDPLWGVPGLPDRDVQDLGSGISALLAETAVDLIAEASPSSAICSVGLTYSPIRHGELLVIPKLAYDVVSDRRARDGRDQLLRHWHPAGFSAQLGDVRPNDVRFRSDAPRLARELRVRAPASLRDFFGSVVKLLRERVSQSNIPVMDDLVLLAIDGAEPPTMEDLARFNSREALDRLRKEGWLP
jgi:hypothetical protein